MSLLKSTFYKKYAYLINPVATGDNCNETSGPKDTASEREVLSENNKVDLVSVTSSAIAPPQDKDISGTNNVNDPTKEKLIYLEPASSDTVVKYSAGQEGTTQSDKQEHHLSDADDSQKANQDSLASVKDQYAADMSLANQNLDQSVVSHHDDPGYQSMNETKKPSSDPDSALTVQNDTAGLAGSEDTDDALTQYTHLSASEEGMDEQKLAVASYDEPSSSMQAHTLTDGNVHRFFGDSVMGDASKYDPSYKITYQQPKEIYESSEDEDESTEYVQTAEMSEEEQYLVQVAHGWDFVNRGSQIQPYPSVPFICVPMPNLVDKVQVC